MPLNKPDNAAFPLHSDADTDVLLPLMEKLLDAFEPLHRLSGSVDAEHAADSLIEQLSALGLTPRREICPLLLSDPVLGTLELPDFPHWQASAKTRSFSAHCPEGIAGPLYYDSRSQETLPDSELAAWQNTVRGRIVVADRGLEDYVQQLCRAGALGLVHIWGSAEEALHEETVGPIWGTPVPDDGIRYPSLPVVCINQRQGRSLLEILDRQAHPVTARLVTQLNVHVADCSLPVVDIPGEIDEFVLLSSHYDSWHQGLTDNATGNALCLAMAAWFHRSLRPKRGLRIAWWPGHSNARYGGSTWYADRYREELQQKCIAHINVDSPGCEDATEVVVNASGAESFDFLNQAIIHETGTTARRITPLGKGGDQSFWGCGIPLHFAFRVEPGIRTSHSPGSGGGWWWHTEADTRDKVDSHLLLRDCRIHTRWLAQLLYKECLPLDPGGYLERLTEELDRLQSALDPQFDLSPVRHALLALQQQVQDLGRWQDSGSRREDIKQAIALWHRVRYSSTDDFHYDYSYHGGAFPGLQLLRDRFQHTTSAVTFLMLATQFTRQRSRALSLLVQSGEVLRSFPPP